MTAKELKRIFSKGECLSLDAMRLYNDGKLPKNSMHEVEKHLLECNLCSGAVDGLNTKRIKEVNKLSDHIQRRLAVYMNTPPTVPFFRRFGIFIISGFLLVAVGGTCLYFSQTDKTKNPVLTDSSGINNQKKTPNQNEPNSNAIAPPDQTSTILNTDEKVVGSNNSNSEIISNGSKTETLPADIPGQANTFTVNPESVATTSTYSNENPVGPSTRSENSPLHVKSVLVYPPVTHESKQVRKDAKDGQLGRASDNSEATFKLDEMPSFPGGNEALKAFIIANFKSSPVDKSKLTRFATGLMFVVNSKTGAISAPDISYSISPEVDKELLRVISALPYYNPGKKRGEVEIMIGITFE